MTHSLGLWHNGHVNMPLLRHLTETNVIDSTPLVRLQNLEYLQLDDTAINDEDRAMLQLALPSYKIDHEHTARSP